MSSRWLKFTLFTLLILALSACSGKGTPTITQPPLENGNAQDGAGPLEEVSPDAEVQEIDALAIYAARCSRCHGADRTGKNGPALLPGKLTQDAAAYQATIRDGSGPMPSFKDRLTADEISALVEFILSDPQ